MTLGRAAPSIARTLTRSALSGVLASKVKVVNQFCPAVTSCRMVAVIDTGSEPIMDGPRRRKRRLGLDSCLSRGRLHEGVAIGDRPAAGVVVDWAPIHLAKRLATTAGRVEWLRC